MTNAKTAPTENVADPSDINSGINYFFETLLFSEAALVLADALPKEDHPHV